MNTIIEYHLKLLDGIVIVVDWKFDNKEQALAIYNEKKDKRVYEDYTWKLEQVETRITNIKLN